MADVVFKVVIDGREHILQAATATKKLRTETDKTTRSTQAANKSASSYQRIQERGVYRTANNVRNFSKLSQTIGSGDNGVVGAYATLAANTFAVVAAFSALQRATESLKILKGLETQGARLGQTLTVTAKSIREITNEAISMSQAMSSTAQLTAGGFDSSQIKALTEVAKDASGALGRDLTDAMDRLTRGVTKLEPELLDELGIMTKLDEATNKYATVLNKSAASLTATEKRQAFLNAVLEEGQTKFGGIGDATDEFNAFTRLAATGVDIFNSSLGGLAKVLSPVVELFASNKFLFVGAVLLYASSLRKSLIPALSKVSERQEEMAKKQKEALLDKSKDFAEAGTTLASAQNVRGTKGGGRGGQNLPRLTASSISSLNEQIELGSVRTSDFNKALSSLNVQLTDTQFEIDNVKMSKKEMNQAIADRTAIDIGIKRVTDMRNAHLQLNVTLAQGEVISAAQNATIGTLGNTFKSVISGSKLYYAALVEQSIATRGAVASQGLLNMALIRGGAALKTGALAAKAFGITLLNLLPVIGQIVMVVSLLWAAIQGLISGLESDAVKAYNKELETFTEIAGAAAGKISEFNRFQEMSLTSTAAQIASLNLAGNAINEVVKQYINLEEAARKAGDSSFNIGWIKEMQNSGINENLDKFAQEGIFNVGNARGVNDLNASLDALATVYALASESKKEYIDTQLKEVSTSSSVQDQSKAIGKIVKNVGKDYENLSATIADLTENYKNLEASTVSFIQSSLISTPVDDMTKSLSQVNSSIRNLRVEIMGGTLDINEFSSVIRSMGTQSRNLLGAGIVDLIEVESLVGQVDRLNSLKKDGQIIDERQLASLKNQVKVASAELAPTLEANLITRQNEFREMQVAYRLNKQILDIENAKFKTVSNLFTVGAEGYIAREEHEEKLRNFRAAELDMQSAILKELQVRERITLAELETAKSELLTRKQDLSVLKEYTEEYRKLSIVKQLGNVNDSKGAINILEQIPTSIRASEEEAIKFQRELAIIENNITNAKEAMQDTSDAIESLDLARTAILAENLSEAQEQARAMGEEFKVSQEFFKELNTYADSITSINRKIKEFNSLLRMGNSETLNGTRDILATYQSTRLELIRNLALRAVENGITEKDIAADKEKAVLSKAENDAAEKKLSTEQARYNNAQEIFQVQLKEAEVTARLEMLRGSIFDVTKNTVEWQQQGLAFLQKQVDLSAQIRATEVEITNSQIDRARIMSGLPNTEQTSNNDAVRAATEALKIAKARAEMQISVIDAEYSLLEAQKIALQQELIVKRAVLKQSGASDAFLAPVDKAISLLNFDVNKLRNNAVKAVELTVVAAAEAAATAVARANAPAQNDTLSGRFRARQRDVSERDSETAKALKEIATPFIVASQVTLPKTLDSGIKDMSEEIGKKLEDTFDKGPMGQMQKNVQDIRDHMVSGQGTASGLPIDGRVTSGFGRRNAPTAGASTNHGGIDIAGNTGDYIRATMDGIVDLARTKGGYGKTVEMTNGNTRTLMAHMSEILVSVGQQVKKGDIIGRVGQTGTATGPHVHYEVSVNGRKVDPQKYSISSPLEVPIAVVPAGAASPIQTNAQTGDITKVQEAISKANPETLSGSFLDSIPVILPSLKEMSTTLIDLSPILTSMQMMDPFYRMSIGLQDFKANFEILSTDILALAQKMGPDGEIITAIASGITGMLSATENAFTTFANTESTVKQKVIAVAEVVSQAFSTISSITQAASDARVRGIDAEIAAEQKRDGKSVDSQKKIEALEKKKEQVQRKQFNLNKKMMMAQAIIATATGVAQALSIPSFPMNLIMAGVIGAMGAAQLAIIAGTSFQGGSAGSASVSQPSKISVGRIGSGVNLDNPNANAGGEIGYLRGTGGVGQNSSNFRTVGSATGGMTNRGYGHRAFLVGEKGPETIEASEPMKVNPNKGQKMSGGDTYIIQATDAKSFEDMLRSNPAPIIEGLQKVANSSGKSFMSDVDTRSFGGSKR